MHICHVNLATGFSGGESQTLLLIKQQLSEGYELTVVANPKSPLVDKLKGLTVTLVLTTHFTLKHQKSITASCQLIHVHEGRAIYWAWLQSLLHDIPYIVTRRIDNPLKNKLLSRLAYSRATFLVGLSDAITKQLARRYEATKIEKIPSSPVSYPLVPTSITAIKEQFTGKFVVLQASNLLTHKGHQTTIEAAYRIEKLDPNIQFVFLGDGDQMQALKAQASALNNISFMGKQRNMGDWFASADLFIHPSYSEGLGSVILEAMQAGLAVVASNAGGIPDIVHNRHTGLLVEARQAAPLVDAIITMKNDVQLKEGCIKGANEMLSRFKIEQTSQQYRALYQQVIAV